MKHITVLHKIVSYWHTVEKCRRKSFIRIFSVLLLIFTAITTLQAQDTISINIATATSDISIPMSGAPSTAIYKIYGTTSTRTITVRSGYVGTIILKDLTMTSSKSGAYGVSGVSCITVEGLYDRSNLDPFTKVEVILEGTNTLEYTKSSSGCAFQVNQGAQIHINAINRNNNNSGTLTARNTAAGSAAIGAPYFGGSSGQGNVSVSCGTSSAKYSAGGNIIIGSGTVKAYGFKHGAGIGGGWWTYYNGYIVVYGGDVTAESGQHAAGIGSGCPNGNGVQSACVPDNSAIIALPPAKISAKGTNGNSTSVSSLYGLNGAQTIFYMNDPGKPLITVHTVDSLKGADIYLDLSETIVKGTTTLADIFGTLEIGYDLNKVKVGKTDAITGLFKFNGYFKDPTTFFTDASSINPATSGRPYMPVKEALTTGGTIILPLLETNISFKDYKSKPLETGYSTWEAKANAYVVKMEFNDLTPMTDVTYKLQDKVHFSSIIFLASDSVTVLPTPPTTLNNGDIYYMILPVNVGKPVGIYSDVLMITGKWKGIDLPGYIRRIGEQRVVFDDSGTKNHIKVTANPHDFIETFPTNRNVIMSLNIDHTGTNVLYNPSDVTAKYIITREPNYNTVVAMNPISTWNNLNIPTTNNQNKTTIVPFNAQYPGVYYIHWYVESGVVYAHSQYPFGHYIITEPIKVGYLTGNPFVCAGQIPSEIKGEISTGGSEYFTYQWQMSTDNGYTWTNVGGNTPNYTPDILTVSPTYFQRITIDNQFGSRYPSNIFSIKIANDGQDFYWSRNAGNSSWNNPNNWVDASGGRLLMVPLACSNVHIPGGAAIYPSLHPDNTPTDVYGPPMCNNIIFEYGAELIYQHKLIYQKAYVQYNWGYYDGFSGVNYGDQPNGNVCSPASKIKRDTWHALAAPLKSMATGDFALAGYPLAWQAGFALSDPKTGATGGEIEVGNFDKQFVTNDKPLSETNNAIAVKVALYDNIMGCKDHCNIEGLKGIIEIPYFENDDKKDYYPAHSYDKFAKESKFFYFNPTTLQILHSPIGRMKRGDEAYRFVYEEENDAPRIQVAGIPSTVAGYKQIVKRQNSSSLKVMIGNPFMTSINARQFFDVNNTDANNKKIVETAGYQLFNSTDQTWRHYDFARGGTIPPLQAFIITLTKEEVELLFPLEGTYALAGSTAPITHQLEGRLYLKSTNNKGLEGDYSVLVAAKDDEERANVKKMIYSDGNATPEAFFIASNNKSYNLIQAYEEGIDEIKIAVKSSDTKNSISIIFENVDEFYAMNDLYPVLFDNHLGVKQNLMLNNKYDFNQRQTSAENHYIDADRFVLQLVSSETGLLNEKRGESISITYQNEQLDVRASQNIKKVEIYDALGRLIYSEIDVDKKHYTKSLPLIQDIYIVKVYTENGGIKVGKIMTLK